jgi:predicted ATPase
VTDLPNQKLLSHLSALKDSELVYERGIYPESTYIFKHALIQEGVYQSLLKTTRQKYHRDIAQVLEDHFPGTTETHPELLGHHFTEAGLLEQAIPYWQRAGERAIRRSANIEAVDHLTTALELLKTLPDTAARDEQELLLHATLGPAWLAVKGYGSEEVGQTYTRAYELCQRLEEPPQLVPILIGLWLFHLLRLELQSAHELGKRLLSSAQRTRDPVTLLSAHYALGNTLSFLGELPVALEHLEQGIAIYDPQTHGSLAFRYGEDPGVACYIFRAWCLWYLGYPEQARQRMHETVILAQSLSHPHSLAFAHCAAAVLYQLRQERHTAREQAEAAITISREQGFPYFLALGKIVRNCALPEREQAEERITQMRQSLGAYRATGSGSQWIEPYFLALLAEAYGNAGQVHEGLHAMTEALDVISTTREFAWEAELYRIKGELLLNEKYEMGNTEWTPEDCFKKALDVARDQQAKSWELRAAMSLSRLWQQQDRQAEARQLLAEVYNWFTEGFDTADLQEAKALLEKLGV